MADKIIREIAIKITARVTLRTSIFNHSLVNLTRAMKHGEKISPFCWLPIAGAVRLVARHLGVLENTRTEIEAQAALRLALLAGSNLNLHPIADKTSMTVPILGFLPFESAL